MMKGMKENVNILTRELEGVNIALRGVGAQ